MVDATDVVAAANDAQTKINAWLAIKAAPTASTYAQARAAYLAALTAFGAFGDTATLFTNSYEGEQANTI